MGKEKSLVPDGSVVLRGVPTPLSDSLGKEFVLDCARHVEDLLAAEIIKERYWLTDAAWVELAANAPLQRAVAEECDRRIRSGVRLREDAQRRVVAAPAVLSEILNDKRAPAKERIAAGKELRSAAGVDQVQPTAGEKFSIHIDFGAGVKPVELEVMNAQPKRATDAPPLEYIEKPRKPEQPEPEEDSL
jgi:hypothetical protein